MIKLWLRKKLNKEPLDEINQEIHRLNKEMMEGTPEHPYGHPHTQGKRDGLQFALNALETEYK